MAKSKNRQTSTKTNSDNHLASPRERALAIHQRPRADLLPRYERMRRQLESCHRIDEAAAIKDPAEALRASARISADCKTSQVADRHQLPGSVLLDTAIAARTRATGNAATRTSSSISAARSRYWRRPFGLRLLSPFTVATPESQTSTVAPVSR